MTAGRHRLDGQRRDALRAWLRTLPARLSPRRVPRAAGGAPVPAPVAGAPEAPAPPIPVPGAGASPGLPRRDTWVRARRRLRRAARDLLWAAGDRLCARRATFPAGSWLGELGWKLSGPFAMAPPALRAAAPGEAAAPGSSRGQSARRASGRETLAIPAAGEDGPALVRPYYLRWEAMRDGTLPVPEWATGPEMARLLRGMLAGAA